MPHKDPQVRKAYLARYKEKNRLLLRAKYKTRYREVYGARQSARRKVFRLINPDKVRDADLQKKYGISLLDYERMLAAQNGVCAICLRPELTIARGKQLPLAVDHNHSTSVVRGLLCSRCNPAVGYLQDDPLRAEALAAYLRRA